MNLNEYTLETAKEMNNEITYFLRFAKVRDVKSPTRGTQYSAGIDFYVPNDFPETTIYPREDLLIPSGIKCSIPNGFMLLGVDKSGVASSDDAKEKVGMLKGENTYKPSITIGAKLIDEDYQGEIHIHIINTGHSTFKVRPGMKISQFVLIPVLYSGLKEVPADELFDTTSARSEGGFGSTGID